MNRGHLHEILASVVVFLVALPLCMGIAIASGAPAAAGLVSGIIGGVVVGLLAGSPLQVSGPAAGLAVIVYEAIQQHGLEQLWAVVLLAGVFQVVAARLSAGRWFRAVAPTVIYAMLAGIGILIFSSQFHVMVDDAPRASGLMNLVSIPQAVWKGLVPVEGTSHHQAAAIGLLALGCLVGWSALQKRVKGWVQVVPPPLVAVVVATTAAAVFALPVAYVDVPDTLGGLFIFPTAETASALLSPAIIGSAFVLATIASAQGLLCASAVDRLHDGERSDMNRELFAQGVGNAFAGVLGGLPVTGVIVRSTANVEAGGKTRWSAVLHGVWLLGLIALAPFALRWIPIAALAAVLVFIGYRLIDREVIKMLAERGRGEVVIYGVTVFAIVATDLLTGLIIGIGMTLMRLAWEFSHLEVNISETEGGGLEIDLRGSATFVSLPVLTQALQGISETAAVKLHLDHLHYVDHACLEYIGEWERQRIDNGGSLEIAWDVLEMRLQSPRERAEIAADGDPPPNQQAA